MVRYRRDRTTGAAYFFTVTLRDRSSGLLIEHIDVLRAAWKRVAREWPFQTEAVVVLPDHIHAIWRLPEDDANYADRWRAIKRNVTLQLRASGGIASNASPWQSRFWERRIRDDEEMEAHVNYIHFNPVKHGHAMRAGDWPHSSVHRFVRTGMLSARWLEVSSAANPLPESLRSSGLRSIRGSDS